MKKATFITLVECALFSSLGYAQSGPDAALPTATEEVAKPLRVPLSALPTNGGHSYLSHSSGQLQEENDQTRTNHKITVRIHNYTEASLSLVQRAERAAGNILGRAGLTTVWVECPVNPNFSHKPICNASCSSLDFVVNLLPCFMSDRFQLDGGALGLAFEADDKNYGFRASIFYDVASDWARQQKQDLDQLLGAAIAHELGHLLLGTNSHSTTGLMSAFWSPKQLLAVQQRGWDFSPADAEHAQKAVARRRAAWSPVWSNYSNELK